MTNTCPGCRHQPVPPGGVCEDCRRWCNIVLAVAEITIDASRDVLPQGAS